MNQTFIASTSLNHQSNNDDDFYKKSIESSSTIQSIKQTLSSSLNLNKNVSYLKAIFN